MKDGGLVTNLYELTGVALVGNPAALKSTVNVFKPAFSVKILANALIGTNDPSIVRITSHSLTKESLGNLEEIILMFQILAILISYVHISII